MKTQMPNAKKSAFLIFADLDGTFTPMDIPGKIDFCNVVKEIQETTGAQVKFCPISGRPSGYVLRLLHEVRDMLEEMGCYNVCDYGAAEQGALIVDAKKSYAPKFTGKPESKGLKAEIAKIIQANEYCKLISDEPDKLYTCSIHIHNEAKAKMSEAQQRAVYESVREDVWRVFGKNTLDIAMSHNCMEVMTKEISKAQAIRLLTYRYMRTYNVVGLMMAGDAENDKIALKYMSRLAEIPGVRSHVFLPANAQSAVESAQLEKWKTENKQASGNRILKSHLRLFKGVTYLIREELKNNTLVGTGPGIWRTKDDIGVTLKDHYFPINNVRKFTACHFPDKNVLKALGDKLVL